MAKKVRVLTEDEWISASPSGICDERVRSKVIKRGSESRDEMERYIYEYLWISSGCGYDCTGQFFTTDFDFCRAGGYWVIRFYESMDI